ncbi:Adenylate kinase [uncultured archaeon]|nr:Adenylate kinase [uncultured archaeon]
MNLIFVGPQGSGKGTYGKMISEKLCVPHISMGDLLRNYNGKHKDEIQALMKAGKLGPLALTLEIIKERLSESDAKKGFILDGFPRNLEQARELDKIAKVDKVIDIEVPEDLTIKRLNGRWSCPKCGTPYNIYFDDKPKVSGICDKDGEKLVQRADDADINVIKARLQVYHSETEPILDYYTKKVIVINGDQHKDKAVEDILNKVRKG